MLGGIIVAVALSLLEVVMRASSPKTAELGRVPATDTYRDIDDHPGAETFQGLYLYRFEAPLFFANSAKLRDDIVDAVADYLARTDVDPSPAEPEPPTG